MPQDRSKKTGPTIGRKKKTSKGTSRSRKGWRAPRARSGVAVAIGAVGAAMKELRARWYVFGAQAVALHGAQRTTKDIDVTVLTDRSAADLLVALERQGIVALIDDDEFVARTRVLPCVHARSGWKIDVVLGGPGFEELVASQARPIFVEGVRAPLLRLEHLLTLKTLAGRPQDLADIDRLLRSRPEADVDEVRSILAIFETELEESGLVRRFEAIAGRERRR